LFFPSGFLLICEGSQRGCGGGLVVLRGCSSVAKQVLLQRVTWLAAKGLVIVNAVVPLDFK